MPRLFITAALALSLAAASAAARAESLTTPPAGEGRSNVLRVVVTGVSSSRGHVRVDVCSRSEFLGECRYSGSAPAKPGGAIVEVKDLPPGVYAVQAYDDRNDNQKVDRNFVGLPTEAVGFSNNAPVPFTGPSFKASSFTYAGGEQQISLRLHSYLH